MRRPSICLMFAINVALSSACSSGAEPGPDSGDLPDEDPIDEDLFDSDKDEGEGGAEGAGEDEGAGEGEAGEDMADPGYCDPTAAWDPGWVEQERALVEQINAARASGYDCGALGWQPPAPALAVNEALSCASRIHALDMAERNYFEHTTPEGKDPNWRLGEAGFTGSTWAASIGAGYPTAADVVEGWLATEVHCGNIMRADFVGIGVGYAFGPNSSYAHYWTLMVSD